MFRKKVKRERLIEHVVLTMGSSVAIAVLQRIGLIPSQHEDDDCIYLQHSNYLNCPLPERPESNRSA